MTSFNIGWFGKVPLSTEFLKHNYAGPVFADLDQWLQEGLVYVRNRCGESWSEDYDKAEPWNFLWCPPEQDEFLVGTAIPSTDKAGRHFPFLLFIRILQPREDNHQAGVPGWCHDFLQEARAIGQHGWKDKDLPTFKADLSQLTFPKIENFVVEKHREHYQQFLENHTTAGFLSHVYGEDDHPPQTDVFKNIQNFLKSIPVGRSSPLRVGLKFPLIPISLTTEPFDLLFWMDMAKKLFPPNTIPTHVFWKRHVTPEQSYMLVFPQKPGPQAFLNLIRPETEDVSWCDFSPQILEEALQSNEEKRSEDSIPMYEPSLSLQEWLDQCCVGK